MSYRDDLDAAVARADAADRENRLLAEENQRLTAQLADAQEMLGRGSVWLGGSRTKALMLTIAGGGIALAVAAGIYGRVTASYPEPVIVHRTAPPFTIGTMVADGPDLGRWTLEATRCVPRSDGIELTAVGQDSYIIWLTNNIAEVEVPNHDIVLHKKECISKLDLSVTSHDTDPPTYDGHIELDCSFDNNTLRGRIEFQHCR